MPNPIIEATVPVRFTIRRCVPSDAATIASLGARLFVQAYEPTHPEPELGRYLASEFSVDAMAAAIAGDGVTIFVVEDSTKAAIGYAHLHATTEIPSGVIGARAVEIVRFYVDASRQRMGVGRELMSQCCSHAKSTGANVIWLQVWSQAPWAIEFYRRMGFSIVGKKPFYFGKRVDEDHIMPRRLFDLT
jgi:diamine N-acetyltransferase